VTTRCHSLEVFPESKDTSRVGRYGNFYAYYGNTAVDLDPLPVSRAHLSVVEQVLFDWDMFEMAAPIESSAKCEVHSVIRFLNAKGECPTEIHKQTVAVYGNVMNRQNVVKWCHEFSEGRTDVHDEQRSGRPSLISHDLLQETIRNSHKLKSDDKWLASHHPWSV